MRQIPDRFRPKPFRNRQPRATKILRQTVTRLRLGSASRHGELTLTDSTWSANLPHLTKNEQYDRALTHIRALIQGETDAISVMATVACELHHAMDHFDWTGFYRVVAPELLKVGPYQGNHGCLVIPFSRGVCGKCASEARTQIVPDVAKLPYHIACSSSTRSEIVLPVLDPAGNVRAVLDVDSDTPEAFDTIDARRLEEVCQWLTPILGS